VRFVIKGINVSDGLDNAHANPPLDAETATGRWRRFRPHKKRLLEHLLAEQYYLCCYSELRADEADLGYHIEHVVNKGMVPARTFDYENLSASAIQSERIPTLSSGEVFGGHTPGKMVAYDEALFISCRNPDCEKAFAYLSDGRVVPRQDLSIADSERAQYTINLLNLNSPYLVVLRRNWWDTLDFELDEYLGQGLDLTILAKQDLLPIDGKLKSFFSLTRRFYGPVAETVLSRGQTSD